MGASGSYGLPYSRGVLAVAICLCVCATASAGLIDDFSLPNPREPITITGSTTYTGPTSSILGGTRTIDFVQADAPANPGAVQVGFASSFVPQTLFAITNPQSTTTSATLTWDGDVLGDLTDGGASNAFRLNDFSSDLQATLVFTVKDTSNNESNSTIVIGTVEDQLIARFEEFVALTASPADFTSIDSIKLDITGPEEYDLSFSAFDTTKAVPEPSTFALLGMGCVGLFLYQRRRKRAAADTQAS